MSKYSHYEMCEKIFGSRYKFDKHKNLVPYSKTDMWDKLIEWKDKIVDFEAKLAESEKRYENRKQFFIGEIRSQMDIINNLLEENYELKQQLGIKEKEHELLINHFEEATEELRKQIKQESDARKRFVEEVKKLKQQLAEKEKEIEEVRSNHANLVADIAYKAVNVYTAESKKTGIPTFYKIHYSQLLEIEDMNNIRNYAQDKISFAVERLEKVKEEMSRSNEGGYIIRFASMNDRDNFNDIIDQQIEELRNNNEKILCSNCEEQKQI